MSGEAALFTDILDVEVMTAGFGVIFGPGTD